MSKNLSNYEPDPIKTNETPVWELVIEDMRQRDNEGRKKYGTALQTSNGRDALVDAFQESTRPSRLSQTRDRAEKAMRQFAIGDEVWVDVVEGHFGKYIHSNKAITKAKVIHIDCVNPSRMIVSHNWQAASGMEISIVDAKYVFHKYGDILKHRATRRNVKVGDLVAAIEAGRREKEDDEVLFGVVYKITKSYVHFQSENGLRKTRVDNCIVLSRQEENQNG